MQISKLHYITTDPVYAELACQGGADWIQLRVKNKSDDEWRSIAEETKSICRKYGATLIINDNVMLAKSIGADGVHLGKEDMPPDEARQILGPDFIIGGTANTFEDIKRLTMLKVDYIGLGPFRFTQTKTNLSPILGLDGYRVRMKKCAGEKIQMPIIAIGGIRLDDVDALLATGIYGIAVSSAISEPGDISSATQAFIRKIKNDVVWERMD
jgi:thiamine-phosphate pyrophosphorylase